ncbi:MAG: DUF4956 domain-containing protein [Bacteroidales bacterium]|nr:DUF4956 domain-containing protein [Bacteroidales bacterium]
MPFESIATEDTLLSIMIRFIVNITVLFILIRMIYYRFSKKPEYLFSFFLMGIVIFFICSILETVDIQLGMALGLFAIFAILRFRTVNYTVKDMTYVFTVIGVSVVNSQANITPPVLASVSINTIILLGALFLEVFLSKRLLSSQTIIYNKTEFLKPDLRKELLKELSEFTGQNIEKIRIVKADLAKCTCELEVFYREKG